MTDVWCIYLSHPLFWYIINLPMTTRQYKSIFRNKQIITAIYIYSHSLRSPSKEVHALSSGEGWIRINQFKSAYFCVCPQPEPGFQTSFVLVCFVFSEFSSNERHCWYWWNCWPSPFILSFHQLHILCIFLVLIASEHIL